MPTKPTQAELQAYEAEDRARQTEYDNFRYTDAQREQVLEFINVAMKVLRGEAEFESLKQLLPLDGIRPRSVTAFAYRGGKEYSFDTRFLNKWISIDMIGTESETGKVEPYHLYIDFRPSMQIQRERLESLLQLKVVPGISFEGGNLATPQPLFHGLSTENSPLFIYSPLRQPTQDYTIEVMLSYGKESHQSAYETTDLHRLSITRRYLSPEKIRARDNEKIGHLSRSGQRVAIDGKYVPVFADDELTRAARELGIVMDHGVNDVFQQVQLRDPRTGRTEWFEAGWQRLDHGSRG